MGLGTLTSFLSACGGKPTSKQSEWLFDCWMCGGEQKLYFNTQKLIGYCQKCARPVSLKHLASELGGISVQEIQEYIEEAAIQGKTGVDFQESITDILLSEDPCVSAMPLPEIALPPTFRTLEEGRNSVTGKHAISYMVHRGFNLQTLFQLQFGYCSGGTYANRIIIPFWEGGRLVYWQARDFTKKVSLRDKIWNPSATSVIVGKSSVLFNYDGVKDRTTIAVCESWGSALATGASATALNGKVMSAVQQEKLLNLPAKRFVVVLDHGAESYAWGIAQRLAAHRETYVAMLPFGDPAEVPKSVLLHSIKNATPYTKDAHLKFTVNQLIQV